MIFIVVLLAAAFGSFANVLVHRLPLMILAQEQQRDSSFNLFTPSSHCPQCCTPLKWWYNIPIVSFLLLRGHCAVCDAQIPWRYLWVELGTVLFAVLCVYLWGWTAMALAYFVFVYFLWVLAWIDALHYLLPDTLTLLLLWLGLLYHAFFMPERLVDAVVAAAFGYTLLFTVYAVYYGLTGKQGLGFGDMKLLAAIGAWLGVGAIANVLIFACALALLFALALRFKVSRILPFGPFLAVAAVLILLMRWDVGIWLMRWL